MIKLLSDIKHSEIDDQIQIRKSLMMMMVGSLYPRMLQGEIDKLKEMMMKPKLKEYIEKEEMEIQ